MELTENLKITTTEMHTGGEPLRIIESGYPEIKGSKILDKRQYVKKNLDAIRKFLMMEPRGHFDMYGALLVEPDIKEADLGVLFMHNEGYSTMCGHAVVALGRYAVDRGIIKNPSSPETMVNIQCPCGLVQCYVEYENGKTGQVRFHSVPAFAFAIDFKVNIEGYGTVNVDIGYGGAFYALVSAQRFNLDVCKSSTNSLVEVATKVSDAVKSAIKLHHPESEDLAFLYGTILTDGNDEYDVGPTANVCVFADKQVDRSPTGSGVTARIAVQFARGYISIGQCRIFTSGATYSQFKGKVIKSMKYGEFDAVVVEVSGRSHYTGSNTFILEDDDELKQGFLLK